MNSQWIEFIFFLLAVVLSLDVTRRAVMVVIKDTKKQHIQRVMRQLRKPLQPHVSVLVYGKNNARELEKTVRQVRQNRYSSFDIVAISDRSTDDTATRMQRYCQAVNTKHPSTRVAFLKRRTVSSKIKTYQAAYRKSVHGDIVLLLEAGQTVDRYFIKRAVALRSNKKQWRLTMESYGKESGYAQQTAQGLYAISQAFMNMLFRAPAYTVACERRELPRVVLPAHHMKQSRRSYIFLIALLACIGAGWMYGGVSALWYGWLLFTLYSIAHIWLQVSTMTKQKWTYTFSAPSALFFIPVTTIAYSIAQLDIRK